MLLYFYFFAPKLCKKVQKKNKKVQKSAIKIKNILYIVVLFNFLFYFLAKFWLFFG